MPIALPAISGVLTTNLFATALIGTDTPRLASGVAMGLVTWVPQVTVSTVDAGSGGVGTGIPIPWLVPQPLLLGFLTANIPPAGFTGLFAPSLILGLANGLATAFIQMLVSTTHPTVGTGSGAASFKAPPAATSMVAGFASAGLVGDAAPRLAAAIGFSLDSAIASLVIPIVIVGSASPSAASGVGTGKII
jgi:hypothetical protein